MVRAYAASVPRFARGPATDREVERATPHHPAVTAHDPGMDSANAHLLDLHSVAGNHAVARLLHGPASESVGPRVQRSQSGHVGRVVVQRQAGLLTVGSRGGSVRALQQALNDQGASIAVDGIFGPETRAAVVRYQMAAGLRPDGLVGPRTRASLGLGGVGAATGAVAHQVELEHLISEAVGHQVSEAVGHQVAGGGGTTVGGSVPVPALPGGPRAGGSYDTETGAVSAGVSGPLGGIGGSYDPDRGTVSAGGTSFAGATAVGSYDTETGKTSGGFSSASGDTSGAWSADVDEGTGTGTVNTKYGSGSLTVEDDSVHASVDVPGVGAVDVDVPRPDWI